MGRIDGEGGQHREEAIDEVAVEPAPFVLPEPVGREDCDARIGQLRPEFEPALLLLGHERVGALVDGADLCNGAQAVLGRFEDARLDLAVQAGDADHVELIEVRSRDREEAQALEHGVVEVLGLFHHPLVEGEPAQLSVDELVGRREALRLGGPLGSRHSAAPASPLLGLIRGFLQYVHCRDVTKMRGRGWSRAIRGAAAPRLRLRPARAPRARAAR